MMALMSDDNTSPALIRRVDALEKLGVSESTFDRWVRAGLLPRQETDIPGVWVLQSSVDAILAKHGKLENR